MKQHKKTSTFTRDLRRAAGLDEDDLGRRLVSAELTAQEFNDLEALRESAAMSRSRVIRAAIRRLLDEARIAGVFEADTDESSPPRET